MAANEAVKKFRTELDSFVLNEDNVWLDDDAWWEQFGDLLDVVLAAKARERRAARDVVRCVALYRAITRCVRTQDHPGNHYSPSTGQWKNEKVTS